MYVDVPIKMGDELAYYKDKLYIKQPDGYTKLEDWFGHVEPLRSFLVHIEKPKPSFTPFPSNLTNEYIQGVMHTITTKHDGRSICNIGSDRFELARWFLFHYSGNSLVVCSKSEKRHWQQEIQPTVIKNGKQTLDNEKCYLVTSNVGKNHTEILNVKWNTIVFDDAHVLRRATSKLSTSWIPVLKQARAVLLLTDAPVYNKPVDVFNLLHVVNPDVFKSREDFSIRYNNGRIGFDNKWIEGEPCRLEELKIILQEWLLYKPKPSIVMDVKMVEGPVPSHCPNALTRWKETNNQKLALLESWLVSTIQSNLDGCVCISVMHYPVMDRYAQMMETHGIPYAKVDGRSKKKPIPNDIQCLLLSSNCQLDYAAIKTVTHVIIGEIPFTPHVIEKMVSRWNHTKLKLTVTILTGSYDEFLFRQLQLKSRILL